MSEWPSNAAAASPHPLYVGGGGPAAALSFQAGVLSSFIEMNNTVAAPEVENRERDK